MQKHSPDFHFIATGIGSVPFTDIASTCSGILQEAPRMPFWPQFPRRSPVEDMSIQFSEGMPLLSADLENRSLAINSDTSQADALVAFYDRFMSHDLEAFALSREYAPGLYRMREILADRPADEGNFFKGQTVGPVTFAAGIRDTNGTSVLHNPELLEALTHALAIKARWQVGVLAFSGRRPVIFLDEPYLSGFGSAFSPIQRETVIELLRLVIDYLRTHTDALIGIHCCGNTDWSMILDAGPDIVNFDAFEHLDYFLLYPDHIRKFLLAGGAVAWGIVPTSPAVMEATFDSLASRLRKGLAYLEGKGIDRSLLAQRSLLTPACGMGSMTEQEARKALELLGMLSRDWTER